MLGAVDTVLIVKDLVRPSLPLEPDNVDRLDSRPTPNRRGRVEPFDANLFGEEVQLRHGGGC